MVSALLFSVSFVNGYNRAPIPNTINFSSNQIRCEFEIISTNDLQSSILGCITFCVLIQEEISRGVIYLVNNIRKTIHNLGIPIKILIGILIKVVIKVPKSCSFSNKVEFSCFLTRMSITMELIFKKKNIS